MHELPDLLSDAVGDATVTNVIEIGGGDTLAVTDETTYLYRSDGLLKDESIESFDHAVERLSVRTKRRKSSIQLQTIDTETSFTVPADITDSVVEAMMRGILLTNEVVSDDEVIAALFRFSELTLVVTDRRLFEHVGSAVWDRDFETVEYDALSGLDFERGSVATQVVLETNDRRRRVKVPNEHAGTVRREIQDAVFAFHEVSSIEELRAELEPPEDDAERSDERNSNSTSEGETRTEKPTDGSVTNGDDDFVSAGWSPASDRESVDASDSTGPTETNTVAETESSAAVSTFDDERNGNTRATEVDGLVDRVDALSELIERQTELIESQQATMEQLVDELRRGR